MAFDIFHARVKKMIGELVIKIPRKKTFYGNLPICQNTNAL